MNETAKLAPRAVASKVAELAALLSRAERTVVLTGAGCSTESGIPDYRDAKGGWKRKPPMHLSEFLSGERPRRRYWARSMAGFRLVHEATPNHAHRTLAELEIGGRIEHLITQNVDGLHQRAGSRRVVDLHGRLDRVRCVGCGAAEQRDAYQRRLEEANPTWHYRATASAPDGDADLESARYGEFALVACGGCGGVVKPDVVFFGESVPKSRVSFAMERVEEADALLVVGSSLMVWSGYRFARRAAERGIPVAAINLGATRADPLLATKVEAPASVALAQLASLL